MTGVAGSSVTNFVSVASGSSVYLLSTSAAGALPLSGNAQLKLTGVVDIDSSSSSALSASGNAIVSAGSVQVVGKTQTSGNAKISQSCPA